MDHGYSGVNKGTKVHCFLKGIKITELKAVINVVQTQPEKYGKDFDTTMSYLGQMVMKKSKAMQSIQIVMIRSQPLMTMVMTFMGKIDCKKYPKAVWNSMSREQQIQVRKL